MTTSITDEESQIKTLEQDTSVICQKPFDDSKFIHSLRGLKKLKDTFFERKRYIKLGYRAHQNLTVGKCTKSLFMLHNETFNTWSHLLCGVYYLY